MSKVSDGRASVGTNMQGATAAEGYGAAGPRTGRHRGSSADARARLAELAATMGPAAASLGFREGQIVERGTRAFDVASAFPRSWAVYDLLSTR
jgi:hypothetical protein